MKNLLHIYLIEINEYEIEILGSDTHYYESKHYIDRLLDHTDNVPDNK